MDVSSAGRRRREVLELFALLGRLRGALRRRGGLSQCERRYLYWALLFLRFHRGRPAATLDLPELRAFVGYLGRRREMAESARVEAFTAIVFLYRAVLSHDGNERLEVASPQACHSRVSGPG